MPDDFDLSTRRYVTASGRVRSRAEIRAAIDKLTERVKREAKRLASAYYSGSINEAEFVLQMRELLKSGHIISATVGRGGKARMTQSDWGKVGAKLKWQYKYLDRFARQIKAGMVSEKRVASRAQLYPNSFWISYQKATHQEYKDAVESPDIPTANLVRLVTNSKEGCAECAADESMGWVPADVLDEIGSRECGDHCKCSIEYMDDVKADGGVYTY